MSDGTRNAIYKATQAVLRGLVRLLLRHGVDYSAFSTLARQVFADTAYEKLERENGKATASAVSALTGLSRKEIKRLRETESNVLANAAQGRNRAVRVLAGWTTDPQFMSDGRPRVLSLDATSGGFQSLVESHSGGCDTNSHARVTRAGRLRRAGRGRCAAYAQRFPAYEHPR